MLAAVLCTAAPSAGAAVDGQAARYYEDALTRYEKKDVAGAIVQLKNALKIDGTMLPVHVLLGRALLAQGQAAAAEVAFDEALRLGVDRAEVVVPLARAVIAQGKQPRLLDDARFAVAGLQPGVQARVMLLRASAHADVGDTKSALKAIDDARLLDPASAEPWLSEVPVRIRARQPKEAMAAAGRALQLAPGAAEALYVRGTVAHAAGDLQGALALYDKALAANPSHDEALVSRAGLLIDLNRPADARADATQLKKVAPKDPRGAYLRALLDERDGHQAASAAGLKEVTALLDPVPMDQLRYRPQVLILGGLAHHGLGEKEKAKPYLEAVRRQQPSSPVSKLLAQMYLAENNVDRAIEALDGYLRASPGDAQAQLLLASAHFSQGRHARAAQLMTDALKINDTPELRTMLGVSLLGGGKVGDAARELEAAFGRNPQQLQAGMALATIYLQGAQLPKAVAVAQKMAQQAPNNPGVQNLLGTALLRQGDTDGARTAFDKALQLEPRLVAAQINLARLDVRLNKPDSALARLNAVLAADDKHVEALSEVGLLHERRGQLADAQRFLGKAADHAGAQDLQPLLALAEFHLRNGRPDGARAAAQRLAAKAPDALPVLLMLSRVALASRDAEGARAYLARASRAAGYGAPMLLQIASLQVAAGSLPGAAYTLDKALNERPDFLPAQALLTEVELRQGDAAKADARARQIVARHPKTAVGHALLGDIAASRGQMPQAVEAYRKAHAIEQTSDSLLRLTQALSVNDPPAALALAEQWLKAHPADTSVRRALADGQARSGNLAAARASYEVLLKQRPDDAEVLNNLANVLLLLRDPGALLVAEQALARKPGAAHIIGTTGWAAFKAGQTERALQLLRDARLRDANNPDTRYFLGAVLADSGRTAEAREELQGALKGGRAFASAREAQHLLATLK